MVGHEGDCQVHVKEFRLSADEGRISKDGGITLAIGDDIIEIETYPSLKIEPI